jgi:hypothetical protein
VQFRHEHAHFASFQASGLSEFHAIFSDYKLFLFSVIIRHFYDRNSGKLRVPLLRRSDTPDSLSLLIRQAVKQINQQESLFFGYGTNASIDELFETGRQEELIEKLGDPRYSLFPNMMRYRKFLRQMRFTTDPSLAPVPDGASVYIEDASERVRISSRSVQEAFAITVEVVSEYVRAIYTSHNARRTEPKRLPPPGNTAAIEMILSAISDKTIDIRSYVFGQAGADIYWAVSLVAFAAMQVPVLEDIEGEPITMGSLKQLCPAHRLAHIIRAIEAGTIPSPLATYNRGSDDLLAWVDQCHRAVGDPWSLKFYRNIAQLVCALREEFSTGEQAFSMHKTAWAARTNFLINPVGWLSEAGFFCDYIPFQIRYIQTSDNCILTSVDVGGDELKSQFMYLLDSGIYALEAMIFDERWHSSWDKIGSNYKDEQRRQAMVAAVDAYVFPGDRAKMKELQLEILPYIL